MEKRPKIGLALSSGGARGACHIGVIKTLQQANIPIDAISGSSAGAIVAACYACGTLDRLEDVLADIRRRDIISFFDPHLSRESLVKGEKVLDFLRWLTSNKKFEDLDTSLYIMASDLKSGREVVFKKGKIAPALLASMSVPPLFKPVRYGEMRLVDGGLLHLLPVEILKKEGCEIVIASSLRSKVFLTLETDSRIYKMYKSIRKKYLLAKSQTQKSEWWQKINAFWKLLAEDADKNKDGVLDTAENYSFFRAALDCFEIGVTSSKKEEKMADWVIRTDVNGVGIVDLHKAKECIKRGGRQTKRDLPKIRRLLQTA